MENKVRVETHFAGAIQDANEIASEWNELLNTNQFRSEGTNEPNVYKITGIVDEQDLVNFCIEDEFVVIR